MTSLFSVDSKIAVVTGAASGLGFMIASALVEQGCVVYGVGRRVEKLEEAASKLNSGGRGRFVPLPGDVSTKDKIAQLVQDFGKSESKLDILVNSAGVLFADPVKSHPDDLDNLLKGLWSSEWDGWTTSMDVNVLALYFVSVGFAPYMRRAFEANPSTEDSPRETPSIINIGSIAGLHNARDAASVSYQVSKAAVSHLTTCLATRFLPLRIRVNAIMPGLFPTEMTNTDPKAIRETHKAHFRAMPENRAGAPEDIVGPVVMLSSRAGAYMTGNVLDVSGGRTLLLSGSIIP